MSGMGLDDRSGKGGFLSSVSVSMEERCEMRYQVARAESNLGRNDDPSSVPLPIESWRKTRRVTATAPAYSTFDQSMEIDIQVVFGDQPRGGTANPELPKVSGVARSNKRGILNKKQTVGANSTKRKSQDRSLMKMKEKSCSASVEQPMGSKELKKERLCMYKRLKPEKMLGFTNSCESKAAKIKKNKTGPKNKKLKCRTKQVLPINDEKFPAQMKEEENKNDTVVDKSEKVIIVDKLLDEMWQKLHFLTTEQKEGLKNLNVSQGEEIMHLTLSQLKSIGITKPFQVAALMNVVENNQDMGECKSLKAQELNSVLAVERLHTNKTETDFVAEKQTDRAEDVGFTEGISISKKIEKKPSEGVMDNKNSLTLQELCQNFVENKLRIATWKISQRIKKIRSSNVQREVKKKELLDIIKQLNLMDNQLKAAKTNRTFTAKIAKDQFVNKINEDNCKKSQVMEIKSEINRNDVGDTHIQPLPPPQISPKVADNNCIDNDDEDNDSTEKCISNDADDIVDENTTPLSEKKNISYVCTNIKTRRLKISKKLTSIEQKKDEEKSGLDKDFNALEQEKSDKQISLGEKKQKYESVSQMNQKVNSADAVVTDFMVSSGPEKPRYETTIIKKMYVSPAKSARNGQSDNCETLQDLRYKIDKKILKSGGSCLRDKMLRTKQNTEHDAGYPIEQVRNQRNRNENCLVKYSNFGKHRKDGDVYNNGSFSKFRNKYPGRFHRQHSFNWNDHQYNKSIEEDVLRKHNNRQGDYYTQKLSNRKNETSNAVQYEEDEEDDWDKDEKGETNNNIKGPQTPKSPERKTKTTTKTNTNNPTPTCDENDLSTGNSVLTEKFPISRIEASVPQSPLDKDSLENKKTNLNPVRRSCEMMPDEVLNNDNWDENDDVVPSMPTLGNEIACPSYPSVCSLSDYTPAMEIDSRMSFPAVSYRLYEIEIPKFEVSCPESLDKLLRSNSTDPRLLKHKKKDKVGATMSSSMLSYFKPQQNTQNDPRQRSGISPTSKTIQCLAQNDFHTSPQDQNPSAVLYKYLQCSPWYQSLMSTIKIQINRSIAELVHVLNDYRKKRLADPSVLFDVFKIDCAGELLEIMRNIGIYIDVNGVIMEEKGHIHRDNRAALNSSAPINTTYSFMPNLLPTATHPIRGVPGFETNIRQQSANSIVGLPSQIPTSFVSCYIDLPAMVPLRPRGQASRTGNMCGYRRNDGSYERSGDDGRGGSRNRNRKYDGRSFSKPKQHY